MTSDRGEDGMLSEQEAREYRETFADTFGKDLDPLAEYDKRFREIETSHPGAGPMELFKNRLLEKRGLADRSSENYSTALKHWSEFMQMMGRHHACPHRNHVMKFIEHLEHEHGNSDQTIENKLQFLNSMFKAWQNEQSLPQTEDFNPFDEILNEIEFESPEKKPFHPISLEEIREIIQEIKHLRDLPIIVLQLKYGIRATAVTNIEIEDVSVGGEELSSHYSKLGRNPLLDDCDNAIVIPESHEGNKSTRTRVMPLDDETRYLLRQYLIVRPSVEEKELFLTETSHTSGDREMVNNIWIKHFPEKYLEDTQKYRRIRSHFGRHWFTTYWSVDNGYNRELVRYMRGDAGEGEAMDEYIHIEFEKFKDKFLENVRKYLI